MTRPIGILTIVGKVQEADVLQFGGSPIKVGEEEYSLFRDHE
jgi:hypothetical protein